MQTSHEVTSCADRGTLRGLVEEALATSSHADPRLVAADLVAALPEQQLRQALAETLPAFVTSAAIAQRARAMREARPLTQTVVQGTPASSARWASAASILEHRICIGTEWKRLADCTADDLERTALDRQSRAATILSEADRWTRLAALLRRRGATTVADLSADDLSAVAA